MIILNQDKTICVSNQEVEEFIIFPTIYKGCIFGINLFIQSKSNVIMLGTFNTLQSAFNEIKNIKNCKNNIYYIS